MFSFMMKRMLQGSTQRNVIVLSEKPELFELLLSRLEPGNQDCRSEASGVQFIFKNFYFSAFFLSLKAITREILPRKKGA
jgi:hypothetical protein